MGMKDLLIGLGLLSCPALVFVIFGAPGLDALDEGDGSHVSARVLGDGRAAFATECAGCHGRTAEGTGRGPALAVDSLGPARFGDDAIRRAVREGVAGVGDGPMPAQPELTDRQLDDIVAFLRELQRINGIR